MDYNNVDLKDNYQRDQNIIDPLSFDTLLLEISCNIAKIDKAAIKAQFETDLKNRIESAREIFNANLDAILADAIEYQNLD